MSFHRRPTQTGSSHPTTVSPSGAPKRIFNVVPQGTVASRVQYLQNIGSSAPRIVSMSHRRESSRTSFSRRTKSRFAQHAQLNMKPDKDLPIQQSSDSFPRPSTPTINHMDEHSPATIHDSAGDVGLIKSHGLPAQDDVKESSRSLSQVELTRSPRHTRSVPKIEMQTRVEASGKPNRNETQPLIAQNAGTQDANTYRREYQPDVDPGLDSEASIVTTSTTRRQNVRDLFGEYGIVRPSGLTSRENSGVNTPHQRTHVHCHVCSWMNSGISAMCWRCHHHFCANCEATRTKEMERIENPLEFSKREISRLVLRPTISMKSKNSSFRETSLRSRPIPVQRSQSIRKRSMGPINVPDSEIEHSLLRKSSHQSSVKQKPSTAPEVSLLSGSTVTKTVKDSPFLIADLLSSRQHVRPFLSREVVKTVEQNLQIKSTQAPHPDTLPCSLTPNPAVCKSPGCRALLEGHKNFRNSPSCPKTKPRLHDVQDTDDGYMSDTSLVEDPIHMKSAPECPSPGTQSHLSEKRISHIHCNPMSRPSLQLPPKGTTQPRPESHVPGDNEWCRYPRTEHFRYHSPGSSNTSSMVGECHHLVGDCPCSACQNKLHNVRCWVHSGHPSYVDILRTPQKQASKHNPILCPGSNPLYPQVSQSPVFVLDADTTPARFLETTPSSKPVAAYDVHNNPVRATKLTPAQSKAAPIKKYPPETPTSPPWVPIKTSDRAEIRHPSWPDEIIDSASGREAIHLDSTAKLDHCLEETSNFPAVYSQESAKNDKGSDASFQTTQERLSSSQSASQPMLIPKQTVTQAVTTKFRSSSIVHRSVASSTTQSQKLHPLIHRQDRPLCRRPSTEVLADASAALGAAPSEPNQASVVAECQSLCMKLGNSKPGTALLHNNIEEAAICDGFPASTGCSGHLYHFAATQAPSARWIHLPAICPETLDCIWTRGACTSPDLPSDACVIPFHFDNAAIRGVTVTLHIDGCDDVIFKTVSWADPEPHSP